ncbi:MAG: FHA domain-containing protein [Polyangiaceae bacterium]|nr:FHA domain-containing protein [Polyangiaceae bacterium]
MPLGLVLRVTDTRDGSSSEYRFARFPVRIGRNQLNDLTLPFPFVSQFHCIIELRENELMLRDLGSRNGTLVPGGRAPAYEPLPLAKGNNSFVVSALLFEGQIANVDPRSIPRREQLALHAPTGTQLVGHQDVDTTAFAPADLDAIAKAVARSRALSGGAPAAGAGLSPELTRLYNHYHQYRNAWAQFRGALSETLRATPAPQQGALLEWVRASLGGAEHEPDFQQLAAAYAQPGAPDPAATRRAEAAALRGLQMLSALYARNRPPPATDAEVVRFLSKVRDTLDVFLNAFIPLRDGQRQFASQLNVGRRPSRPDMAEMAAAYGVEAARDPIELARWLLDWRDEYASGHQALEGAFADLMIHQIAMLNGVMRGVKALLQELSPAAIEGAVDQGKAPRGWSFGPFRYRALWGLFRTRHADLDDGERRIFTLLFGGDFAQAYTQFMDEASSDTSAAPRP